MSQAGPAAAHEQAWLDEMFERVVARLEDGLPVDVAALAEGRAHLLSQIEHLVRLAMQVRPSGPQPLPQVTGFQVLREIGRGGMGAVYLARQQRLGGRLVALKVLPGIVAPTARSRARLEGEARTIARLAHPNVVVVHDVVVAEAACAYAMEWVDGCTLADALRQAAAGESGSTGGGRDRELNAVAELLGGSELCRRHRTYVTFVCRVGVAMARALAAVHAAGLVHRDVKPSNILLRRDGTPLLSDFGLVHDLDATLTHPGHFAGTLAYAPPEQLRGESDRIDARSDVYALGATLYHALALRVPHTGTNPQQLAAQIERGLAPPLRKINPRIPYDLQTIVAKALDADPARRYPTAAALADDLERLLNLQPIGARPAGLMTRTLKLARRNRAAFGGVFAGGLLAAAGALLLAMYLVWMPQQAAAHLRAARLSLLDVGQSNSIVSILYWGRYVPGNVPSGARATALQQYSAAARLAPRDAQIRGELEVVRAAIEGRPSPGSDPRSMGLHCFLRGDFEEAVAQWLRYEAGRDALAPADPLVSAALGVLYLFEDEPARAYPRLRDAVRDFPDVGFLTLYLADAAARCGDLAYAERLFELARRQSGGDVRGGVARVRACLLAARGDTAAAAAAFAATVEPGPVWVDHGRFLLAQGRTDEGIALLHRAAALGGRTPRRIYRQALDAWWAGLEAAERQREIRAAASLGAGDVRSLATRLRMYVGAHPGITSPDRPMAAAGEHKRADCGLLAPGGSCRILATIWDAVSSPSLQSLSLSELAERMEVQDMALWNRLASSHRILRELQFTKWRWPILRPALLALDAASAAITRAYPPRARRWAAGSLAAAFLAPSAVAQPCPSAEGLCQEVVASGIEGGFSAAVAPPEFGAYGGQVFWSDYNGNRIWRYDPVTGPEVFASNVGIFPGGIRFGPGGSWGRDLYVNCGLAPNDNTTGIVYRIASDGTASEFGRHGYSFQGAGGLAFSTGGEFGDFLYAGCGGGIPSDPIVRFGPAGGPGAVIHYTGIGDGSVGVLEFGPGLDGFTTDLYFVYAGPAVNDTIYRLDANGVRTSLITAADVGASSLWSPQFGRGDVFGNSLFVLAGPNTLRVSADGSFETFLPTGGTMTFDGMGSMYVIGGGNLSRVAECAAGNDPVSCFQGLGDLPGGAVSSLATQVSSDGTTVVGHSESVNGTEAFRWRSATGMEGLGDLPGNTFWSRAQDVSADGEVVAGFSRSGNANAGFPAEAFRWTAQSGMVGLGDLPGGEFYSAAYSVSEDGLVVGGTSAIDCSASGQGFRWTSEFGMEFIGYELPTTLYAMNADGTVLGGAYFDTCGATNRPFRWTVDGGGEMLADLPGGIESGSIGIGDFSADGAIGVGRGSSTNGLEATLWGPDGVPVALGDLPGGVFSSGAYAITLDGSVIVGQGTSDLGPEAVMWSGDGTNLRRVMDELVNHGVSIPAGWTLTEATGVARNGEIVTLCGAGINPEGNSEAWIARYAIASPPPELPLVSVIFTTIPDSPTAELPGYPGSFLTNFSTSPTRSETGGRWILGAQAMIEGVGSRNVLLTGLGAAATVVLRGGDPAPWAPGEVISSIRAAASIADDGRYAFSANTDGPLDEYLLLWTPGQGFTVVAQEGGQHPSYPYTWGFTLEAPTVSAAGIAFIAKQLAGSPTFTNAHCMLGSSVVAEKGVTIPFNQAGGGYEFWENFGSEGYWVNHDGTHHLIRGDLTGPTQTDQVVVVDGGVVLQEGATIPGLAAPIGDFNDCRMEASGDWSAFGSNQDGEDWVVVNGNVVATTGAPVPGGAAGEHFDDSTYSFCFDAAGVGPGGDVFYFGVTDYPETNLNSAMVVDPVGGDAFVAVRRGSPVDVNGNGLADDDVYVQYFGSNAAFLANDGRLYFRATLRNGAGETLGRGFLYVQALPPSPSGPGDFDGDGDVDIDDFHIFADCMTGPTPGVPPECEAGDFETDTDVDLVDFAEFQRRLGQSQ